MEGYFFTLDLRPADCGFWHWFFRNAAPKGLFTFTNFSLLFADLEWSALSALKGNHILEQLLQWLRVPSNGFWLNWIGLFCVNRILFWSRASSNGNLHISLALGSHDEFSHISAHTMRHMGSQKACWASFFKMDTTSQLIGGSFALRSSLLLSHSHQEDTFEKNLLHLMPCHHCWAGRYISRLRWREVADESRMNPIWGCTADWEWTQEAGIHLAAMTSHM